MKDAEEIQLQFDKDYAYSEDQRDLANEDIRFIVAPGGHWEGFLSEHYADKPRMQYDMVSLAVKRFMGEWSANTVMPKFRVENNDDEETGDLYDGMFRAAWRKSGGNTTAKNPVFEASAGGFGAIRVGTRYLDDEDMDDDRQEPYFTPLYSAYATVVFDRNARQIDKRDARHVSVIWEYSKEEFERKWPDADHAPATTVDDRRKFQWNRKETIAVIEFYEKVEEKVKVHLFMNDLQDRIEIDDKDLELAAEELEIGGYQKIKSKRIRRTKIMKSIIGGKGFIEEPRRISGKILPIIPFYGFWSFVDGKEHYAGIVREQKDPQRVLNMQLSNLAENAATSPKEVPIFAPEQIEGLESRWASAHLGKKNFQLARPLLDAQGNIIQSGPLGYVKPPAIDPATQGLIEFTTAHIQTTSGGMPQDVEDPDASGKAILAVQKRVDMHTFTIMDNISSSMRRLGECFISIAEEIMTDNRKVLSVSEDGTEKEVQINQIEYKDGKIQTKNKVSSKGIEVYSDVGPSFQSQRRETIEFLKELATVLPEGDPRTNAVLSGIIDNMDGVGLQPIKDFNRKQMLLSGLVDPNGDDEEEFLAEAQQANQEPQGMEKLIESQTALNFAEAQGRQATNIDKIASAEKKQAEAAKIIQSIGIERTRLLLDAIEKETQSLTA